MAHSLPHDELAACRRAVRLAPVNPQAHYDLGNALVQAGQTREAIESYRHAIELSPRFVQALCNLATTLKAVGRLDEAAVFYQRTLKESPDLFEAHLGLGLTFHLKRQIREAIDCLRRAVEIAPDNADAHGALGVALHAADQVDEAVTFLEAAIALHPDFAPFHANLALALIAQQRTLDAIASAQRALELRPGFGTALNTLGLALHNAGRFEEALAAYCAAQNEPSIAAEACWNRALTWLLVGEWSLGFSEYEWRWRTGDDPPRTFQQPRWSGEPLRGQSILLWAEQGYGDTLQFVRYAPLVQSLGAHVLCECQPGLKPLLSRTPGIDRLIASGEPLPKFDYQIPLLSLPRVFKTLPEATPARIPYLFAEETLVRNWRERLATFRGFRVGINWQGRPGPGDYRRRDIPLEQFVTLQQATGVTLISLQKGAGLAALRASPHRNAIIDLGDEFDTASGAFIDTAAIMQNLDLVITSDTAIAHLAGGLGVPVWVGLPHVPDWRWLLDRPDSPWYPTMRLFRQRTAGDWDTVFREIKTALQAAACGRR